ncbi:uncharacterized protein [Arachis hypogaea]|uniref:uncharacterized protein n=1 Tax=Arachis hypogaea TaxID=3818 RepID=UPI000A2C2348
MPPRRHHAAATVPRSCYARSPGSLTTRCHARAEERDRAERETRGGRRDSRCQLCRHRRGRVAVVVLAIVEASAIVTPGCCQGCHRRVSPLKRSLAYAVAEPGQIHRLMLLPPLACHFCSALPLFAVLIVERKCCRSYSFSVPHSLVSFLEPDEEALRRVILRLVYKMLY